MTHHACLKPSTLQVIKQHNSKDDNLQGLIKVIKAGGSKTKGELSHLVLLYFVDDVVVWGKRLVVPKSLH